MSDEGAGETAEGVPVYENPLRRKRPPVRAVEEAVEGQPPTIWVSRKKGHKSVCRWARQALEDSGSVTLRALGAAVTLVGCVCNVVLVQLAPNRRSLMLVQAIDASSALRLSSADFKIVGIRTASVPLIDDVGDSSTVRWNSEIRITLAKV